MAPKRTPAKPKADDTDDTDSQNKPTYDNQLRNLMLFLVHLKRWLPRQVPGTSTFIKYYYILNARQQVVVLDNKHIDDIESGAEPGTFEAPCCRFVFAPRLGAGALLDDMGDR